MANPFSSAIAVKITLCSSLSDYFRQYCLNKTIPLLTVSLLFIIPPAKAWHALGHMIIGQYAENLIKSKQPDSVSDTLQKLLKASGDYFVNLPESPYQPEHFATIAQAATFMDTYSEHERSTSQRHYINRPYTPESEYDNSGVLQLDPADMSENPVKWPNVCPQIATSLITLHNNRNDIANGTVTKESVMAFVELLHFVGDIHQPLHNLTLITSQFPPPEGDRGGNSVKIHSVKGQDNLHSFWDAMGTAYPDVEWHDDDAIKTVNTYLAEILDYVKSNQPPAALANLDKYLDADAFSRAIASQMAPEVYDGVQYGVLSDEYISNAQKASKFLVYYGGEMLADLLTLALTGKKTSSRVYHDKLLSYKWMINKHRYSKVEAVRVLRKAIESRRQK